MFLNTIETPHKAPLVFVGWFEDYPDPSDFFDPSSSCQSAVKGGERPPGTATRTSTPRRPPPVPTPTWPKRVDDTGPSDSGHHGPPAVVAPFNQGCGWKSTRGRLRDPSGLAVHPARRVHQSVTSIRGGAAPRLLPVIPSPAPDPCSPTRSGDWRCRARGDRPRHVLPAPMFLRRIRPDGGRSERGAGRRRRIRHALGLDRSFLEQLAAYVGNIIHGLRALDLPEPDAPGASRRPSSSRSRGCSSSSSSACRSIMAAAAPGRGSDRLSTDDHDRPRLGPGFWVGYLLLEAIFQMSTRLTSTSSRSAAGTAADLPSIIPPALAVGFGGAAYYQRLVRRR